MTETSQRVLNSRYQIEALIGRGGMADVYRARDLSLDRTVAVKMLRPDLARDPIFQVRFRREAQSSASLNHPNIVGVYDTGQTEVAENGGDVKTPYIVMEHVEGVTLRHILHGTPSEQSTTSGAGSDLPPPPPGSTGQTQAQTDSSDGRSDVLGVTDEDTTRDVPRVSEPLQEKIDQALGHPLTEQEASRYMAGVLGALHYSHARQIVHRDIKPSNVMVSNADEVKVMDFGIARALADSAQTMTQTSAVVGTAQYLSPEQARGEPVDHRSDLYSAGCVLFELLTNRPPFTGDSPVSVAYQHVREDAPPVSDYNNRVSPAMESVVTKALTKDPAMRFQSADEFNHAIQQALHGVAVDDAPTTELAALGAASSFDGVVAPTGVAAPLSARTPEDPDIEDYYTDYREPTKRRRGAWVLLWLVLIIAVIAGGTFILARMLDGAEPITVPEVQNMPRSEAIAELSDAGLVPDPELQSHADVEVDHAIGTEPGAGNEVDDGSTVTLYISEGTDTLVIPDGLIGEAEDSVRATLEEAGLEIGDVSEVDHGSLAGGEVTATDPSAGAEVETGTTVDLTVSSGMLELPAGIAAGQWRNDVEAALTAAGIPYELEWVETSAVDFDGEVIGIVADGEPVATGDRIPNDAGVLIRAGYQPEEAAAPDDEDDEDADEDEGSGEDEGGGGSGDDEGASDEDEDSGNEETGSGNAGEDSDDEETGDDETGSGNDGEDSGDEEADSGNDQDDSSNGNGDDNGDDGVSNGGNDDQDGTGDGGNGNDSDADEE